MEPRSKFERFVFTQVLVEAGLRLVVEAQRSVKERLARARSERNGLMVALLALCPIRLKNFADLTIGQTFKWDRESWWISLPRKATKTGRPDDRRVPELLYPAIEVYLGQSRPALLGKAPDTGALWISSTTGRTMTNKNLGTLISKITLETVGIDVSPHLFRTAGASTSAALAGELPQLGSALLGHTDLRITEEHYRRVSSINACRAYAAIVQSVIESSQ
jgi:integrase